MYRLIIVEDEVTVRRGLEYFMPWQELGFEVAGAFGDGLEAFEYIKNNPCDVVLTDIMMGGMDGLEMTKRLRELYPDVLIVILSGYSHFEYAQLALRYKVSSYLLKPVDEEELMEVFGKLKEQLDQNPMRLSVDMLEKIHYEEIVAGYKLFVQALDAGNLDQIHDMIDDLMLKLSEIPIEYAKFIVRNIYSLIIMEYDYRGISVQDITEGKLDYNYLKDKDTLHEIKVSMNVAFLTLNKRLEEGKVKSDVDIIEAVERYIEMNLAEDLGIKRLAQKHHINKDYMNRLFKQKRGETVAEYIVRRRMERAILLLKDGNCKVNQVGRLVGYNSSAYFATAFKEYTGYSPTEYRRQVML